MHQVHGLLYELDYFLLRITSSRVFSILSSSFCKYTVRIASTISERLAPRSEHSSTSVSSSSTSSVRTETPILVRVIILDVLKNTCTKCAVSLSAYSDLNQIFDITYLSRYLHSEATVLLSCDFLTKDECAADCLGRRFPPSGRDAVEPICTCSHVIDVIDRAIATGCISDYRTVTARRVAYMPVDTAIRPEFSIRPPIGHSNCRRNLVRSRHPRVDRGVCMSLSAEIRRFWGERRVCWLHTVSDAAVCAAVLI